MHWVPQMETRQRPRSRRYDAMKDDRRPGDERRDRGRAGREVTGPRRSPSPPPRRPRDSDRLPDSKPRDLLPEKVQPSARHHQKPREHSKERPRRLSHSSARRDQPQEDHKERSRAGNIGDWRHEARGKSPSRARSRSWTRGGPPKSPSIKRQRSRSPSLTGSQRKKSKRDISPRGEPQDRRPVLDAINNPSDSSRPPSRRPPSPTRRDPRSKPKNRKRPRSRRGRSRSPGRDRATSRTDYPPAQDRDHSRHRRRSRSPPILQSNSSVRQPSPSIRGGRPPTSPRGGPRSRHSPEFERQRPSHSHPGPRSASRGSGKRTKQGDESRFAKRTQPVSGANSIEVNMTGRGNFRGAYNPHQQMQAAVPHKAPYNNDPRQFSQSPQHATPNSSYHGSPNHSPYGAGRGGWSGQQYSPPHQYPPQYPQGNYGPPTGPQGHYHNNPSFSPPHSAPTGPMQQYPSGNYRGNYRGGGGGFRGNHFGSGRGNYRGNNFKSTQWNSNHGSGPRGQPSHEDNGNPHQPSDPDAENPEADELDSTEVDQNPFRPSKDLQVEDSSVSDKNEDGNMPPPSRPPPTGPGSQSAASSKFSFAFKASSKPAATTPKPEISQKFNAAPQRREPFQSDNRDREPPRSAPTEPASARARQDSRQQQQQQPAPAPRTRMVKKIMRRLKQRPILPADLIRSDSVFFRKPGNESVVGSGTYGKVFKALHVYTKELVALKRIRMEGERDGFPVTAVREIKLLQSLKHTNIVQLQEVMVEKNDCFMVFEYLSHDLTGLLNHPSFKLDPAQKKHLAMQLFDGLDYLHKRGVLHRDIKAANILVSSDGIMKLADFGLARFYAKRHQLDYTNRVITIWYRSPELLLGETQYGPACDVWSAACVMVEIFTRHAIFPGDGGEINQLDKIYAILGTPNKAEWPGLVDMPWFELLRPGYRRPNSFAEKYKERLPPAAYGLLASMFQYDPTKRPSAAEVLENEYFTVEDPPPRQAVELQNLDGDWHEFESKALRRENERKDREARRAAGKDAKSRDKERKREVENHDPRGDTKRAHVEGKQSATERTSAPAPAPAPASKT